VLFGSDYPHPEGLDAPVEWSKGIADLFSAEDVRNIMGGNMYRLLGLPVPA